MPQKPVPNLRVRLKRIFLATVAAIIAAAALSFFVDYAIYAVAQKNGKTEFLFNPPQAETCVHTLFPHAGWLPCWYLSRYPEQRTNI